MTDPVRDIGNDIGIDIGSDIGRQVGLPTHQLVALAQLGALPAVLMLGSVDAGGRDGLEAT